MFRLTCRCILKNIKNLFLQFQLGLCSFLCLFAGKFSYAHPPFLALISKVRARCALSMYLVRVTQTASIYNENPSTRIIVVLQITPEMKTVLKLALEVGWEILEV